MGIGRRLGVAFALRRTAGARGMIAARARAADWFAVAVEIVAVVLSIFLAFQVDRWWEGMRNRESERLYLVQLRDEAAQNLARIRDIQAEHQRFAEELLAVHRAADDPAALARLSARSDFACGMLRLPDVRLVQSAYQDLSSSERLETLRDRVLRARLLTAAGQHAFVSSQLAYFRSGFNRYAVTLEPFGAFRVDPATGAVTCTTDLVSLARDPAAMSLLSKVYRDQRMFALYRADEAQAVERVRERADCLLSERGCPRPRRRSAGP